MNKFKLFFVVTTVILISFATLVFSKPIDSSNIHKVLKVIDGDTFYIDFNDDGIIQKEEKSRLNGANAFELKYYRKITDKEAKEYNLTYDEIYSLGYLGKVFATQELLNKDVYVKFSSKSKLDYYGRNLVSIYYGDNYSKDFAIELLQQGLGGVYLKSNIAKSLKAYSNLNKIRQNVEKIHSTVILNTKNKKYHKLSCPYGQMSKQSKFISLKEAQKHYKSANCCFYKGENDFSKAYQKRTPKLIEDGKIDFYYIRAREYRLPSIETRTEAGKSLVNIINNAKYSVDFAFYGLAEQPEVLNALLNAQKRGVRVRGIIDMNLQGRNDYTDTMTSIAKFPKGTIKTDYASDLEKQNKIDNKEIKYYGKFYGHIMHNKFCIVDENIVWTGTVNISMTGIGGFNENVVLLIKSKNLAALYKKEMDEMYKNERFHDAKKEIYTERPLLINNTEVDVYFSPTSHAISEGIIPEIRNAKNYIYVSMFLISHYQLTQELINAKKRGVDVKLIVEANHAQQKYSKHETLRSYGVPVKVENWPGKMHAKLAVIDDKNIIVGSTNWTKAGFEHNDENLLILRNIPEAAQFLRNEFQLSWDSIPEKWLTKNPKPEGADSPGSCFDGIDNDYNRLIDAEDPACKGVEGAKMPSLSSKKRLKPTN